MSARHYALMISKCTQVAISYTGGCFSYRRSSILTNGLAEPKYHMWITKYRHKLWVGDIAERAREVIRQICATPESTA